MTVQTTRKKQSTCTENNLSNLKTMQADGTFLDLYTQVYLMKIMNK